MDILSIDALGDGEIAAILDRAGLFFAGNRGRRSNERLQGKIVFNLFYENSTRTAMSFATAAHRLGASAISLSVERSSVQKGETLEDTARALNAMRPDALVIEESGMNDPRVIRPPELGGWGLDGAWADDFHHALRALLTGEHSGWYEEFGEVAQLAKAFHRPHVHDG